jgi:outer membrane protein TolC
MLLLALAAVVRAEEQSRNNELLKSMVRIVLENNPLLESQASIVAAGQRIPEPRSTFSISGVNLNAGAGFWNTETGSFDFIPTASVGVSFSLRDPSRSLNILRLKKEKEDAAQEYQEIKNSIISDLFTNVREILKLESQKESLEKLKIYLEDYGDLMKKQVRAGVEVPEPEKLWELKERILGIEVELSDAQNKLATIRLETAMRLGGSASEQLLDLLWKLGGQPLE